MELDRDGGYLEWVIWVPSHPSPLGRFVSSKAGKNNRYLTSEWLTAWVELLNTGAYSFVPVTCTVTVTWVVNWGEPPSATVITSRYDFTDSKSKVDWVVTRPLPSTVNSVVLPKAKKELLQRTWCQSLYQYTIHHRKVPSSREIGSFLHLWPS